ncbi:pectinesterase [Musa troglodytarum]|uniref:Pectinesterase n=1 Tax=Musa troglodytarum TaxID=320322 RepID=A0A9E7L984_9LILI|nr:pectinesterase [Musa troglodytarum]
MASSLVPLLLVLLLLSTSSDAVHGRQHHRHAPLPSPKADAAPTASPAIRQACCATRSPDLCQSTLSHLSPSLPANPSALDLALAAISAASNGLQTARANAQAILDASASNLNRTNAARNCLEFLSLSNHRLAAASGALPAGAFADARAFAGAAELYQYDCWSAFKYVNDTQQVADAMAFLANLANVTGGATAMVAALQRYGADISLWAPPQTERDGYWPDATLASPSGEAARKEFPRPGTPPDATVCKEGGCQFRAVQAAVDAAPEHSTGRYVIYIKEGVYEETVRVPFEKTNLVFVGDGMGKTVITGSLNADTIGVSTYNTATVGVSADGFMARDLTFANTAGPDKHQAVAFRSDSDLSVLESVEFLGHQDTLYAHSLRQFYKSCRISGTVDFIFGNSATVFRDCLIFVLPRQLNPEHGESNTVTAHGRTDPAQSTGFVFDHCNINGSDEYLALYRSKPAVHRTYLGRPWKEYSRTVFIECNLAEIVRPEGWAPWSGDFALQTLFYGEFGSSGPGANATARVPWSSQIPAEHLGVYSVENFIQGDQWIPFDL